MAFEAITRERHGRRELVPLAVALPLLLERAEAELANERLQAGETQQLRRRAELIRSLLRLVPIT